MRVFKGLDDVGEISKAVMTTGSFDGVHIGHKVILNRLANLAKSTGGESVLLTFYPHPRKVLYPETAGKTLKLINSQQEKVALLQKTGLDNLVIIPFTIEFSQMSSFDFIRKILVGKLHAKTVVVGFNHHFGHNQEGGFEDLYQLGKFHGFGVEEIAQQDIENETVSSTRIRKAITEGKIQRANAYLDHYYMIMGMLLPSENEHTFGVEIQEECKLIPPAGFYAVTVIQDEISTKALLSIRNQPQPNGAVQLIPSEGIPLRAGIPAIIYFHKQIQEGLIDNSSNTSVDLLKKEIEELIY